MRFLMSLFSTPVIGLLMFALYGLLCRNFYQLTERLSKRVWAIRRNPRIVPGVILMALVYFRSSIMRVGDMWPTDEAAALNFMHAMTTIGVGIWCLIASNVGPVERSDYERFYDNEVDDWDGVRYLVEALNLLGYIKEDDGMVYVSDRDRESIRGVVKQLYDREQLYVAEARPRGPKLR